MLHQFENLTLWKKTLLKNTQQSFQFSSYVNADLTILPEW